MVKILQALFTAIFLFLSPVCFAQQTIAYQEAKHTNQMYNCSFDVPSFFGETEYLNATVQGNNFYLKDSISSEYAIIDDTAYYWMYDGRKDESGEIVTEFNGLKIDLSIIASEYNKYFDNDFSAGRMAVGITPFHIIPPETECSESIDGSIVLPDQEFQDYTNYYIDGLIFAYDQQQVFLNQFPFKPFLPKKYPEGFPYFQKDVITDADPGREWIIFKYYSHESPGDYIELTQSKVSKQFSPPDNCQPADTHDWEALGYEGREQIVPCEFLMTTTKGIDIYRGRYSGEAYYALLKETLVIVKGILKSEHEAAAIIDSLEELSNKEFSELIDIFIIAKMPDPEPKPLDFSDAPFAVYIPEYTVEKFELMRNFLRDKSEYDGSNSYVHFFYGANWNRVDEAKYSVEQESVKTEFNPLQECGRAKYEFKETYNLIGPCEAVGQTNEGEDVYFFKDWNSSYYVIDKNGTNVKIWSFGSIRLDTDEALKIFNSLRSATNEELAEMRPRY